MRIECEVCSATYTIDDAQLSDQPIGAQCPYCGHVKLVRKGDQAAARGPGAVPPFGTTSAQDLGFGGPPPAYAGANAAADLGPGLTINPRSPPSARPAPFPNPSADLGVPPFGGATGSGGGPAMPSWKIGNTQSSALGRSQTNDLAPPGAPGAMPSIHNERFGSLDNFGGETEATGAKCQVCGTPLTDEFDKVIGLCDVHQRDRRGADAPSIGDTSSQRWFARHMNGQVLGPMPLEDLRSRIRQGEFTSQDEFSKDGASYSAMAKYQEIAYLASLALGGEAGLTGVARPRTSYARGGGGTGVGRAITWALAVVLIAGVVFLGVTQRKKLQELYEHLTQDSTNKGPSTPNPLKKQLANWRLAHPDVSGTAHEHLVTARARHLEDTWRAYQLSEDAYERALLLDEDDPNAIAGYVENLAIWKYPLLSQDEVRLMQAALRFAGEVAPENPAVHRANAALALARGELGPCRNGADRALERDATDGMAKLLLAGCYMEGNVQLAITEAERASRLVPELRRADRVLAVAYSKIGRYTSAIKLLDNRLKVDPKNAALHILYGNIMRELAQLDQAQAHYRQAIDAGGDVQEAQLALGDVLMEAENYAGASVEYRKASEVRVGQAERVARAFSGWAHAELARGHAKDALHIAQTALQYSQRDPEALLVYGEGALSVGSATTAMAMAKRALEIRSGEPAALVLSGRAAAASNQRDKAIKIFEEAITNDPADARLKGILAALYLTMGGSQQAYTLMRKAAEIDPDEKGSRARVGPLALSDVAVKEAIESFRKSASEEANASVASSSMGMLYYHLGDKGRAIEAISRALRIDDSNTTALLYDAQLALERNDPRRAQAAAERILAIERGTALGHLMLARALYRKNELDGAREQYDSALRSNPGLLAAKVELAGIDIKQGERDRGIAEMARAFQINPSSLHLRRLLLESGF